MIRSVLFGQLTKGSAVLIDNKSKEVISNSQLFLGLTSEVLEGIMENSSEMEYEEGQLIIKEGDTIKGLYIIVEGETSIQKKNKNQYCR